MPYLLLLTPVSAGPRAVLRSMNALCARQSVEATSVRIVHATALPQSAVQTGMMARYMPFPTVSGQLKEQAHGH